MSVIPRIVETDGLPAPVMHRVCSWCSKSMGVVVCDPSMDGKTTHGICLNCRDTLLASLPSVPESGLKTETPATGRQTLTLNQRIAR